jgi:hypothetical protein
MKDFSRTDKGRELAELGYALYGDVTDLFGVRRKFHTRPLASAGSHCYFDSLRELRNYIRSVREIRQIQNGELTTLKKSITI